MSGASCQWTLLSLGIGQSSSIDLVLNATARQAGLVNRVLVSGGYDGQWVEAENYSAIQAGWLECCSPQLLAAKTARVDPADSMLIHYRISLKNRENYSLALTIRDELPEGMAFVNSSASPAQRRGSVLTWNIADLGPGEVRNIDYLARAQRSGIFASPAYIEAWAGDGAGTISAEISGQVYVPGDVPARSGSDDWQPPACFGLNCTAMGGEENWMPCLACSAAEMADPFEFEEILE
jgi:hypothetical protein